MPHELTIRLLGPFVLERDGRPLPETIWRSRQERRLLTMLLARRGHRVSSERLIEWLWPGADHAAATVTLRSAVSSLRRTLGPETSGRASSRYILTSPGGYAWNQPSDAWIDADEFLALTTATDGHGRPAVAAESAAPPSLARLERAIALYRGDFLEDEPEASWAMPERERLRTRYLHAVQSLATAYIERGDAASAVALTRRGLEFAPLHEPLWREQMRAQMLAGDAAGALTSYERYRAALDHELGALPAPQTQELHAAILRGSVHTARRARHHVLPQIAPAPSGAAPERETLIGRKREIEQLHGWLADLAQRRGGTVAIIGEAGIGKSRLADQLLREAVARGAWTVGLRCAPLERELPFAPLGEALGRLVRAAPEETLRRLPASALAQVADLLPALRDRLPQLPTLPPVPPEEHRHRLLDALVDLAVLLSRAAPLVALCDDAQWADDATLALIGRLARRAPRHALLIVLAYRVDELPENAALHGLLRTLGREMLLRPLLLHPLDEGEVEELVAMLGGVAPRQAGSLARRLAASAGGNPLFLTVAVQALLEQFGATSLDDILPHLESGAALPELGGARPIRDLVLGRLERLPRAARELAEQIAVLARPVSLDLIEEMAGEGGLEAARDLIDRHVLAEDADGRLGFGHELVRSIVAAALPSPRRRLLHQRAAQAIVALHGERPERAAEIAHHLGRSGRGAAPELLHYAATAGDHARRTFAYRAALGHYDAALESAARLGEAAPEEVVHHAFAGRLHTCETLLDWDGITATAARYEQWAAGRAGVPATLISPRRLVLLHALSGDLAAAAALSQQTNASGQTPPALADMLRRTAQVLQPPPGGGEAASVHVATAVPFVPARPVPGEPARELPDMLGGDEAALALFQVGWVALVQGRIGDSEPCLMRSYELSKVTDQPATAVLAALQIAHLHALRGQPTETERWLTLCLESAAQAPEATWASIWPRIYQGFLWLLDDQLERAGERFTIMEQQLAPLTTFQSHRASVQVGVGLTALGRGDLTHAAQLLSASVAAPQALYGFVYVAALHGLARLAALDGDIALARARLQQALEYSTRRQLLPEYVRTAIEIGRIERDFGEAARALPLLGDAAQLAADFELVTLAAAASALHRRLSA